jgi:molybdate transport system substrate-binding protein
VNGRHPLAVVDPERNALGEISLQALRAIGWGEGVSKRVRLAPGPGTVLDWVAHGDAALGVALANAARRDQRVRWVGEFPPDTHPPIRYQVAVRAGTPVDAPARAFVHALYGETAREAFRANGLTPQVPR